MKRTEISNLNTAKLNRCATIGKSREVDHKQTKEAAKPSVVLAIRK